MNFTVDSNILPNVVIYANLSHKYQSKFNFYFSKSINQIIFNQTTAIPTIVFKDSAIFAEPIEYLKRQYFIVNQVGIEEIFERINMLAGFYTGAVLLRYEHPMMIITRTKQIFLKRLKRNKKMLTEEGSSDQSKSHTVSRSVQLHTNTFLDSVNSSELSKKTAELRDQLFSQFKEKLNSDLSFDYSIHDIHNPRINFQNCPISVKQSINSEQSFAEKLLKLSKNISLNQMIDCQAMVINLSPIQSQMCHLVCDFDQIDRELTIKNYEKLRSLQKQNINLQDTYLIDDGQKFRKKSKMIITPIDQNGHYLNHQKTIQNPRYRKVPKQMQFSALQRQFKDRNSFHENKGNPKMSAFHQTKKSLFLDSSDERFGKHQESYKTLQRFKPVNMTRPNNNGLRHIYSEFQDHEKGITQQANYLQRHRSSNVFNSKNDHHEYEQAQMRKIQPAYTHERRNSYKKYPEQEDYQRLKMVQKHDKQKYSPKNYNKKIEERHYVTQFQVQKMKQQRNFQSSKFKDFRHEDIYQERKSIQSRFEQQKTSHMPITTQNVKNQQPQPCNQSNLMEDKQQKKKRIREKAAQLLSRVKSQQYLTTRMQTDYLKRY